MQTQQTHIGADLAAGMDDFAAEVKAVHQTMVQAGKGGGRGFTQSLHSYINGLFARIDLLSAYWEGTERDQLQRMVGFMNEYFPYEPEANSVAAQMWRHQSMPTGDLRSLYDISTGHCYLWVVYWGEDLPSDQHFRFHEASDARILSLSLVRLIEDVCGAIGGYFRELDSSVTLQNNYRDTENRLNSHKFQSLL